MPFNTALLLSHHAHKQRISCGIIDSLSTGTDHQNLMFRQVLTLSLALHSLELADTIMTEGASASAALQDIPSVLSTEGQTY